MSWLATTRQLLETAPRQVTLAKIARDTGLRMPWLSEFKNAKIDHPSIDKVQILHDYLVKECARLRDEATNDAG